MSVELNQTIAEASLDNLQDIIVPDTPGFFPLAPGWYVLLFILLTLLLHFGYRSFLTYRQNKYRRDALDELPHTVTVNALLSLTKRVALSAYGREQTAILSGDEWWTFMESHSDVKIASGLRETLEKSLYDPAYKANKETEKEVAALVKVWIETHKRDDNV